MWQWKMGKSNAEKSGAEEKDRLSGGQEEEEEEDQIQVLLL